MVSYSGKYKEGYTWLFRFNLDKEVFTMEHALLCKTLQNMILGFLQQGTGRSFQAVIHICSVLLKTVGRLEHRQYSSKERCLRCDLFSEVDHKKGFVLEPIKNGRYSKSVVCRPPWSQIWERVTAHNKKSLRCARFETAPGVW